MTVVPNTLIGQELERTEDLRFLTGTGTFVDDYEPAGTLHAAILRSSVAHGRIVGLNKNRRAQNSRCACGSGRFGHWL